MGCKLPPAPPKPPKGSVERVYPMRRTVNKDFWKNLDMTADCWEWQGSRNARGYGQIRKDGRYIYAHRAAYELTHGSIPEGLCICHHCDNPPCCNPDHLFAGTMADNMHDRDAKGRNGSYKNRGKSHKGTSRPLSAEQKANLRARSAAYFADPKNRQRHSEVASAFWADPAARQRQSEALKAFHANKKKSEAR